MAQDNKFVRRAEQNGVRRNVSGDEIVSLDARLVRLEDDIRRLKVEFDIFFNGGTKRAPYDTKNRVESVIKRIADERSITFAQRYHYNSMVARYNSFKEMWRRTMKGREEGRDAASLARASQATENSQTAQAQIVSRNFKIVCTDVVNESDSIEKLYQALLSAKTDCGENTAGLSLTDFQQKLLLQTDAFKRSTNCERVAFEVATENGRVVFRARAEK